MRLASAAGSVNGLMRAAPGRTVRLARDRRLARAGMAAGGETWSSPAAISTGHRIENSSRCERQMSPYWLGPNTILADMSEPDPWGLGSPGNRDRTRESQRQVRRADPAPVIKPGRGRARLGKIAADAR